MIIRPQVFFPKNVHYQRKFDLPLRFRFPNIIVFLQDQDIPIFLKVNLRAPTYICMCVDTKVIYRKPL